MKTRTPLWLIDLDNTLYDASWRVMGEINRRMTRYVADSLNLSTESASELREHYWRRYGATLLGLVRHHGIDAQQFLDRTHPDVDLPGFVRPIRGERIRLHQLRGERWLLTNAPRRYALHVLSLIGLRNMFSRIISIEDMGVFGSFRPKPSPVMLRRVLQRAARVPHHVVMVDDHNENLKTAYRLGLRTARVWASRAARQEAWRKGRPLSARRPPYVRLQVNSLAMLIRNQDRLVGASRQT